MSKEGAPMDLHNPPGTTGLLKSRPTKDVFILGAGFSRAISKAMPLTDELGAEAVKRAGIKDAPPMEGGRFETWLSRIAEAQPDLTPAQNAENVSRFLLLIEAIHEILREREWTTLNSPLPDWLFGLIGAWHARQVTVITFNYDLLVEHAMEQCKLQDFDLPQGTEQAQWLDIISDLPPYPPSPPRMAGPLKPTFQLLRLHGALNWYWVPGDTSGATLHRWELDHNDEERARYLPGREPFIVPPAALKSAYYRNPIMTEMWQRAARALHEAERVYLVGYSLPLTDLVSSGMIADALAGRDVDIQVINPYPEDVLVSVKRATGHTASTSESLESFVSDFMSDSARELVQNILENTANIPSDPLLLVGWDHDFISQVPDIRRVHDNLIELMPYDYEQRHPHLGHPDRRPVITMQQLADMVRPGDTLEAVFPNGTRTSLIRIDRFHNMSRASDRWQILVPADRPQSLELQSFQQRSLSP